MSNLISLPRQRTTIIGGDYEPTDAECEFTLDDEISQEMEDKAKIAEGDSKLHGMDENTKVGRDVNCDRCGKGQVGGRVRMGEMLGEGWVRMGWG